MFEKYDMNHDNEIDFNEWTNMLKSINLYESDELSRELFDEVDVDKDGAIDQKEFLRKML